MSNGGTPPFGGRLPTSPESPLSSVHTDQDVERQPILEPPRLEPRPGGMLKSNSAIFGGGPISFTCPSWISTLTVILSW